MQEEREGEEKPGILKNIRAERWAGTRGLKTSLQRDFSLT